MGVCNGSNYTTMLGVNAVEEHVEYWLFTVSILIAAPGTALLDALVFPYRGSEEFIGVVSDAAVVVKEDRHCDPVMGEPQVVSGY